MNPAVQQIQRIVEQDVELPTLSPDRNLCAAVLSRAICDALGAPCVYETGTQMDARQPHKRSAERWMARRGRKPFGFVWICEVLGYDPEKIIAVVREGRPIVFDGRGVSR